LLYLEKYLILNICNKLRRCRFHYLWRHCFRS